MHQEEGISMNSGTETDLSQLNQIEARCNGGKPQETPKKNFIQENRNWYEVTVERKDNMLSQFRRSSSLKGRRIMQ